MKGLSGSFLSRGCLPTLCMRYCKRQASSDLGASTRSREDNDLPTHYVSIISHRPDTQSLTRAVDVESLAVIPTLTCFVVLVRISHCHPHFAGLSVLDRVGQGFLQDALGCQPDWVRDQFAVRLLSPYQVLVQLHFHSQHRFELIAQGLHSRDKSSAEDRGVKSLAD